MRFFLQKLELHVHAIDRDRVAMWQKLRRAFRSQKSRGPGHIEKIALGQSIIPDEIDRRRRTEKDAHGPGRTEGDLFMCDIAHLQLIILR